MRRSGWIPATAIAIVVAGCGGRLLPLPGQQDGGAVGSDSGSEDATDASVDGDGSRPDGPPTDERGPPPVPVCTGENAMCLPPEAGIVWTGAATIKCQGEQYVGPWTILLERLIGSTYQLIQKAVVEEPGFGWTFYDTSGPPAKLTYRVCVLVNDTTAECGTPFTTQGPSDCYCEATSCYLQTACNTTIDDQCMGTLQCGACTNGNPCNPDNNTCCPQYFMSDGWGGCVCAPPTPMACPLEWWDTTTCSCMPGM